MQEEYGSRFLKLILCRTTYILSVVQSLDYGVVHSLIYAEALKKPIKQPLVAPKSNQVIDSKSIELISAYCKVAGIPFKEN